MYIRSRSNTFTKIKSNKISVLSCRLVVYNSRYNTKFTLQNIKIKEYKCKQELFSKKCAAFYAVDYKLWNERFDLLN